MTAAAVAALTVYDMVKGLERGVRVEAVELLSKSGGRSGDWVARRALAARDARVVAVADLASARRRASRSTVPDEGDRQGDDEPVGVEVSGRAGQRLGRGVLVGGVEHDRRGRRRR